MLTVTIIYISIHYNIHYLTYIPASFTGHDETRVIKKIVLVMLSAIMKFIAGTVFSYINYHSNLISITIYDNI